MIPIICLINLLVILIICLNSETLHDLRRNWIPPVSAVKYDGRRASLLRLGDEEFVFNKEEGLAAISLRLCAIKLFRAATELIIVMDIYGILQ